MRFRPAASFCRAWLGVVFVFNLPLGVSGDDAAVARSQQFTAEAYRAYSAGRFSEAIGAIDEALRLVPDSPNAMAVRGITLVAMHETARGLTELTHAVEIAPEQPVLRLMRGWARIDGQLPDDAITDFDATLQLAPECAPAYSGRALARLRKGDPEGAVADATTALERSNALSLDELSEAVALLRETDLLSAVRRTWAKEDWGDARPMAYEVRAQARAALGQNELAVADFGEAIRLRPASVSLWSSRAVALSALHRQREALADAEKACAVAPAMADAHLLAAVIALKLHEHELVRSHAMAAATIGPKDAGVLTGAAGNLIAIGDLDPARSFLSEAVTIQPDNTTAWRTLIDLHIATRDFAAAETGLDRATAAELPADELGYLRGRMLAAQGEFGKALRELKAVLERNPRHLDARLERKRIKFARGDYMGADQELQRAIQMFPRSIELILERADLQLVYIDDAIARELATDAREIDPAHPLVLTFDAFQALGEGQWAAAIECCTRAQKTDPAQLQGVLAIARLESGDSAGAAEALEKMAPDEFSDVLTSNLRACVHLAEGRFEPAIDIFRSIAASESESVAFHLDLTLCLWRAGRRDEAIAALRPVESRSKSLVPAWLRQLEAKTVSFWEDPTLTSDQRIALSEMDGWIASLETIALTAPASPQARGSLYLPGHRARTADEPIAIALLLSAARATDRGDMKAMRRNLEFIVKNTTATRAGHHLAALWLKELPPSP